MIFSCLRVTRLSERVEARNRLLQPYDEEVTIRRTLSQASRVGAPNARRGKIRRLESRLSCQLQRKAGLTALLLVSPRAPQKKQEKPELANSLKKKRVKPQVLPGREK